MNNDVNRIVAEKIQEIRERLGKVSPELESAIRQALIECAGKSQDVLPLEYDFVAESLVVQHEHPGEFVVFEELTEDHEGRPRHVINVLFSSTSWEKLCDFVDDLEEDVRQRVVVEWEPSPKFALQPV